MRVSKGALVVLCGLFPASPALALTISNLDAEPHTVSVTAGDKTEQVKVEAQQTAEPACQGGCKVKLENDEEYQLKGSEKVSIDGGAIFIDSSPDSDVKDLPDIDPDAVREEPEDDEEDELLDEEEGAE